MGSHYLTERERREMYLLLILLVSPAFGRPSSDQLDVGEDISNQLDKIVNFTNETGKLLKNSKLFEKVSDSLTEAEQNILEMEAELKSLKSKIPQLQDEGNFFPDYNKAKRYLRETRQELRELAHRTVSDVRDLKILFEALDETNDNDNDKSKSKQSFLLKISIDKMKSLMIETGERLEEARKKYTSATLAFDNLISSVKTQNGIMEVVKNETIVNYQKDKDCTETVRENCKIASWFTFGLCSLIHHSENEGPLETARVELEDLQAKTDNLLERTITLNQDIKDAIGIMNEEIDRIDIWAESAKRVSKNIEEYPIESLTKYQTIRNHFKNGLDDLIHADEIFLSHSNVPHRKYANDIYQKYLAQKKAQRMNIAENLLEAERNIVWEIGKTNYFKAYNETKSHLRETRQGLRELALRTVTKVRDLKIWLEGLDESNEALTKAILKIIINRVKDLLMIEPVESLKEVNEKYNSAVETFENTKSIVTTEFKDWKEIYQKFSPEIGPTFGQTVDVFNSILTEEIDLISNWTQSAKVVSDNIDSYSEEILKEFKSLRTVFINGLSDLKNAAEKFLAQPKDIIKFD